MNLKWWLDPGPAFGPPGRQPQWGIGLYRPSTAPQVFIRRHTASEICDVVVLVRGQEMVLRLPRYSQAIKWARLERKSYKIPQPDIEPLISEPEIEPAW